MDVIIHLVDPPEIGDRVQGSLTVWARARLPLVALHRLERMQDDLFEKLAQRHAVEFGEALEDLHQAFLHSDPKLYAFNMD